MWSSRSVNFAWLLVCTPWAVFACEEWVRAPSGAKLKLTCAKFRLDFESCLADCGSGASLATIGSAADQAFVNELLLKESGGAYNVLIGNHRPYGAAVPNRSLPNSWSAALPNSWTGTSEGFSNWPNVTISEGGPNLLGDRMALYSKLSMWAHCTNRHNQGLLPGFCDEQALAALGGGVSP